MDRYSRNIAFAIGNGQLSWQKELLERILTSINETTLTILAIALWRDSELIKSISESKLRFIARELCNSLKYAVIDSSILNYTELTYQLELLLALLRTREFEDKSIKGMLAPGAALSKEFTRIVDSIIQDVVKLEEEEELTVIRSHVRLEIVKPEAYYKTPNLLYALSMYLTGDTGANSIQITGVDEGD